MPRPDMPGLSPAYFGEVAPSPFADVQTQCIDEINHELQELDTQISAGQPINLPIDTVDILFRAMIERAGQAEDTPQVEAYIDTFSRIKDVPEKTSAALLFNGFMMGSDESLHKLKLELGLEKQKAMRNAKYKVLPTFRHKGSSEQLQSIVDECVAADFDPDSWINEYAVDAAHKWSLYMRYYGSQVKKDRPETLTYQWRLDAKAGELLDSTTYRDTFVYEQMGDTLALVKDPALRANLLKRYLSSIPQVPLSYVHYLQYIQVGEAVMQDPNLAPEQYVATFANGIQGYARHLLQHTIQESELKIPQIGWKMAVNKFRDTTPEEQIKLLDSQIGDILSLDLPEHPSKWSQAHINADYVIATRNRLLSEYAATYAKQGDFKSATLFMQSIDQAAIRSAAMKDCLSEVKTCEDALLLAPNEDEADLYPELGLQIRFTEARLADDLYELAFLTLEFAENIQGDNQDIRHDYIKTALEIISTKNETLAKQLVDKLLSMLRSANRPYSSFSYLSDAAIKAGDIEEPQRALADINNTSTDSSIRLTSMWHLASQLALAA